jgi:hypothetical protein
MTTFICSRWLWALLPLVMVLALRRAAAHEHEHTHANLTTATFKFLANPNLTPDDSMHARDGSQKEDTCPNYYSHFYDPINGENKIFVYTADDACQDSDWVRYAAEGGQQTAPRRAAGRWDEAVRMYQSGDRAGAFEQLGHVLHLVQDMTSPAHVHNDHHGKAAWQPDHRDHGCEFSNSDADDFENWGWCTVRSGQDQSPNGHIYDYVTRVEQPELDAQLTPRMRQSLDLLFSSKPQFVQMQHGQLNIAYAYVHEVARTTYEFTTFEAQLQDIHVTTDTQPDSLLKRMFPKLKDVLDGFDIEQIGFAEGNCHAHGTRVNLAEDALEEWWISENSCHNDVVYEPWPFDYIPRGYVLRGNAYIENTAGDGQFSFSHGRWDSLKPKVFEKDLFRRRYLGQVNSAHHTQLRIYGDILYPTAVAYGAGLVQTFVDEVMRPPVAHAGGLYEAKPGVPIVFDASARRRVS